MLQVVKPVLTKDYKTNRNPEICTFVNEKLDMLMAPFSKLSSEYMYSKPMEDNGHFIESENYVISSRIDNIFLQGQMVKMRVNVSAKFIPMRTVLKKVFSLPYVFSDVKKYVDGLLQVENVVENFVQGQLWRNKIINHFQSKIVFPLFIFFANLKSIIL